MKSERLLLNCQRGFGLVGALASTAIVGLLGVGILYMAQGISTRNVIEHSQIDAQYANDRALTIAGYLVSNNLVLCREPQSGNVGKCSWGGQLHKPNAFEESEFNLENGRTDEQGSYHAVAVMDAYEVGFRDSNRKIKTDLKFTLTNFGKDINPQSQSMNLIGKIPGYAAAYDDDWWIVIVEAKTAYLEVKLKDEDNPEGEDSSVKHLISLGGIRRPLASPILEVSGSAMCNFSCKTENTLALRPDCRGRQLVLPEDKEIKLALTLLNFGPGALYRADYDKTVVYSSDFYPTKAGQPLRSIMKALNSDDEPLMPMQKKVDLTDTFECESPEIFQANQTSSVDNQQFMSLFTYRYDITVSRFDLSQEAFRVKTSRDTFLKNFDAFNPATYTPTSSKSYLEPRKAGGPLAPLDSNLFRLPSIADPVPVPVPADVPMVSGGDGDGGGGGN